MDAVLGLVERDGTEERQPVEKLEGVMQPPPAEEVVVRGLVEHRLAERELEETDDPDGDDVEGPMTDADARRGHPDDDRPVAKDCCDRQQASLPRQRFQFLHEPVSFVHYADISRKR